MATYDRYRPHDRAATWYTGEMTDPETGEVVIPPTRTKQSFVAECDINNILKQYKKTGIISHINAAAAKGTYQDLPDQVDYQEALNTVIRAEESFATLPSAVRDRFGNDPAEFMAFMADPKNIDEAISLGLATRAAQAQDQAGVSNPAPAPDPAPNPGDGGTGG